MSQFCPQCLSPSQQPPQRTIATHAQYQRRFVIGQFPFRLSLFFACACAHEPTSAAPLFCAASALLCDTRLEHVTFKLQAMLEVRVFLNTTKLRKHAAHQVLTPDSRRGSDVEVVRCIPVSSTCLEAGGRLASTYKLPIPILVALAVLWLSWGPGSLILADSAHYCT